MALIVGRTANSMSLVEHHDVLSAGIAMTKRPAAELLHGRRTTREYQAWQGWMDEAAALTARFADEWEDDPFAYNETASVSALCSAAISAGYLALAEFMQLKRARADRRSYATGRWDLWLATKNYQWGIEFKQVSTRFTPSRLEAALSEATICARLINKNDTNRRIGCLIATLPELAQRRTKARENLEEFASECDYAWRIDLNDDCRETYLYFRYVD